MNNKTMQFTGTSSRWPVSHGPVGGGWCKDGRAKRYSMLQQFDTVKMIGKFYLNLSRLYGQVLTEVSLCIQS